MVAKGCLACTGLLYLISVILLACSFRNISPLEAGIRYNLVTSQISKDRIYTSGRYFTDVAHGFIYYPTVLQTIRFGPNGDAPALRASTSGGQTVTISLSFQYRLMVDKLVELYGKYEKNYQSQYITIASSVVKNTLSKRYSAADYFTKRKVISEVIQGALNTALQEEFGVVEHLHLATVAPPEKTAANILKKIVTQEQVNTAAYEAEVLVLKKNITLKADEANQNSRIFVSDAMRQADQIRSEAQAQAIGIRLEATAKAYSTLRDSLELDNDQLVLLLYLEHLRLLGPAASMAVGVQSAMIQI